MTAVDLADFLALAAVVSALPAVVRRHSGHSMGQTSRWLLFALILLTLFRNLSNSLEWSGVTGQLDWLEDYSEVLLPAVWFFLAYTVLSEQAEDTLRRSEERYRDLAENSPVLICRFLPGGQITYVNEAYCTYLGKTPEDLVGTSFASAIPDSDRDAFESVISALTVAAPVRSYEHRTTTPDGQMNWQRWTTRAQFDDDGRTVAFQSVGEDITDQKNAEAERERLMSAIEQAGEAVVITDANGTIQYVNPAFERTTGYVNGEAVGRNPRMLKSGEQDEDFYRNLWNTLTDGETWSGRLVDKRKDGTPYTEEATISPVRDTAGHTVNYVGVARDISHEVQLEGRLRQAQKMEAVGQLAGGIAHDFNNILQVINGYAELALAELARESTARNHVGEILTAGNRAATVVSQLLAFSRRQVIRPVDLDLNDVVRNLLKMIRHLIGEHIDLDFIAGHKLGTVHVDQGQMEQALINMCVNSRDAMPGGGKLTIETENVLVDDEYIAVHPWVKAGRYVLLSLTDTGCGMKKDQLDQMFDPFFTTKEVGRGTGLGLSTVYGIVKQHNGHIHAYSEVGKGTMFKIYLPTTERRASAVASTVPGAVVGGSETILLAEDDASILNLAAGLLRDAGYTVLTALNGEDAVRTFTEHSGEISLALLDVVMPKMGGKEAMERILVRRPDLPHVFASGYTENAVHTDFIQEQNLDLISKPYTRDTLLRTVREVLDR